MYAYVKSNGVGGGGHKSLSKDLSRSSKLDNFTSDMNADSEKGKIQASLYFRGKYKKAYVLHTGRIRLANIKTT